jgi:hypothetical protein
MSFRSIPSPLTVFLVACGVSAPAAGASPEVAHFVDETATAGINIRFDGEWGYIVGGGVAAFNCDNDGMPELLIAGGVNKSKFYRNRSKPGGPLKFQEERVGLEFTGVTGAYPIDIDGDGIVDLLILRVGENVIMRGLGGCRFERMNERWSFDGGNAWSTAFSATWVAGANWPTMAIGNYIDRTQSEFPWGHCSDNLLFGPRAPNERAAGFGPPVPLRPSYCALSMLFSDWNRSGTASLRVSNDREYYKGGQEQLWRISANEPPHAYTAAEGWRPLQIWGMGIASADLDGSGYPAYFITSMADNKLQVLDGDPRRPAYRDIAFARGVTAHRPFAGGDVHPSTAWHTQFADVNNDGYADLFIVKGNIGAMADFALLDPNNLLLGGPDGHFSESADLAGTASYKRGRGGLLVDLNLDGLLDMVVVNRWDKAELWRNVGSGTAEAPAPMGHWVQIKLRQDGSNRDAIGAWLEIEANGRTQRQEQTIGGGHASGHLGWMHIGLGSATAARLRVIWPGGEISAWTEVASDQFLVVDRTKGVKRWSSGEP